MDSVIHDFRIRGSIYFVMRGKTAISSRRKTTVEKRIGFDGCFFSLVADFQNIYVGPSSSFNLLNFLIRDSSTNKNHRAGFVVEIKL